MPGVAPLSTPVVAPIVATPVEPDNHVPPPASDNVIEEPLHVDPGPLIADGNGLTVTTVVEGQPTNGVNVMVALPAATPRQIPVEDPVEAIEELELLQLPETVAVRADELPTQTTVVPDMAEAGVFTVTVVVVLQPVGRV